jgi:hypothetical protein
LRISRAFEVGVESAWLVVEGFDLLGDREVLLGDGAIRDAGIDHGHGQGLVAEQRSDGVETHAAVDGLGGQGVAELVGGDVADACFDCLVVEDLADPVAGEWPVAFDEEPIRSHAGGTVVRDPVVEELFELGVQRDVAVAVELADGDAQPTR